MKKLGFYDNPYDNEFLGCNYCGANEDQMVETENNFLFCSHCGFTEETVSRFSGKPCCSLFENHKQGE